MQTDPAIIIAERVARAVAPDLDGTPFYVIAPRADSLLTPDMLGEVDGFYYRRIDLALQAQLESDGRWHGEGVAIVLDADRCRETCPDPDDAERYIIGGVLHELCHWADDQQQASEEQYNHYTGMIAALCRTRITATAAQPPRIPSAYFMHADGFVRLCCHALYRCNHGAGRIIGERHIAFANEYPTLEVMHSPGEYIDALYDEVRELKDKPLRSIADYEHPAEFAELCRIDRDRVFTGAAR